MHSTARPLGQPRTGSTIALAKIAGRGVALIADEDGRAIEMLDLETRKQIASVALDGVPSQLMVTADGRILVLLRDLSRLQVFEAEGTSALVPRCSVETASEPVGLASTPDDSMILVSSGWGRTLAAYESQRLTRAFDVALAREPRAVVVSDDGGTAFVSHAVGSVLSAVDLRKTSHAARTVPLVGLEAGSRATLRSQASVLRVMAPDQRAKFEKAQHAQVDRLSCQGFALAKSILPAGRILAPQVFVDPGVQEQRPEGYGSSHVATESPSVAVLDEATAEPFEASLTIQRGLGWQGDRSARDHREECLLPRAAAVDSRSRMLLVSCLGIDNVIGYDAASADPQNSERRRWTVGAGSSGIAVDPEKPRAFVWSQFERSLSVLSLGGPDLIDEKTAPARTSKIALAPLANKLPADYELGRLLFHAAADGRISKDGRACASCHPDGRDDAITWATPEGPRRSIMLAGRVSTTQRFAWSGTTKSLHEHLQLTFDRLEGKGLKSLELDALIAYVNAMPSPAPAPAPAAQRTKVARGAEIFASKEAACSTCHAGAATSDGVVHDVRSRVDGDRSANFKTPTLHLVGGTGPYFHDGRYKTLRDLLRDVDGKMGHTKQLTEADVESLEAYMRTL